MLRRSRMAHCEKAKTIKLRKDADEKSGEQIRTRVRYMCSKLPVSYAAELSIKGSGSSTLSRVKDFSRRSRSQRTERYARATERSRLPRRGESHQLP